MNSSSQRFTNHHLSASAGGDWEVSLDGGAEDTTSSVSAADKSNWPELVRHMSNCDLDPPEPCKTPCAASKVDALRVFGNQSSD